MAELLLPASAQKELRRSQRGLQFGDFREAAKHLENAIKIYPKLAAAHHDLGVCYLRLREYEKAIAEFQEASESDTHLSEPVISLAAVFYRLGRYPEGEAAARRALALDPVNSRTRYLLGAILAHEGRDDSETIELLRDSRKGFPAAHLHLVCVLLRRHATDEAVAELREYLQQPEVPEKDIVACMIERLRKASTCALK